MSISVLRGHGIPQLWQPTGRGRARSLPEKRQAIQLYSNGLSMRHISRTTGLSRTTISNCITRYVSTLTSFYSQFKHYIQRRYRDNNIHNNVIPILDASPSFQEQCQHITQYFGEEALSSILNLSIVDRRKKYNVEKNMKGALNSILIELLQSSMYQPKVRHKKCNDTCHKRYIKHIVTRQPTVYLDELCHKVKETFNITLSKSTMWQRLKAWKYTCKTVTALPMISLSKKNRDRRRTFINTFFDGATLSQVGTRHEIRDQQSWQTKKYIEFPKHVLRRQQQQEGTVSIPITADDSVFNWSEC